MEILPPSADFRAFGVVLAAAVALTFLCVFNLGALTDIFNKAWTRARISTTTYMGKEDLQLDISPPAQPAGFRFTAQKRAQEGQVVRKIMTGDSHPEEEEVEVIGNWTYTGLIIRYSLTTLPLKEIQALFQKPPKIAELGPEVQQSVAAQQEDRPLSAQSNYPPPSSNRLRSSEQFWREHKKTCDRCPQYLPRSTATNASSDICTVGDRIIRQLVLSKHHAVPEDQTCDPMVLNKPERTRQFINEETFNSHGSPVEKSHTGIHRHLPTFSGQSGKTDAAKSVEDAGKPHKWVLAVGFVLLYSLRVVMLPIWSVVLVLDYIFILAGINIARIFVRIPCQHPTADNPVSTIPRGKKRTPFMASLRFLQHRILEPISIINPPAAIAAKDEAKAKARNSPATTSNETSTMHTVVTMSETVSPTSPGSNPRVSFAQSRDNGELA